LDFEVLEVVSFEIRASDAGMQAARVQVSAYVEVCGEDTDKKATQCTLTFCSI